jgi:hypothetical protein
MDLSLLASYAEVVGRPAVLVSLIYVALQIGQSSALVRTSG